MESQAKMSSPGSQELVYQGPLEVIEARFKKLDAILNNKSETFEKKVQSLIEVWKSVSELDFSQFDIQHIIRIIDWAKLHALDIVLTSSWRQTKDCFCDNLVKYIEKAQAGLASCNSAFSSRCQKLADVVRRPWEHPVLNNLIISKDAEIGPEEIEFFCVETIYLVSVRLKKLCENRCEDLALNLSTNYLKYKKQATLQNMNLNATDRQLWFIFDIHIALLYKFQDQNTIVRELKELSLQEGVQLIKRFTKKRVKIAKIWCNFEKIAMYGCRFFLPKAANCDGDENLKETLGDLLKTYLNLSNTDKLLDDFILSIRNLTKLADAEALCIMCKVIHRECTAKIFPFALEMYIRTITADMNEVERLKQTTEVDKVESTISRLAQSFTDLGDLLDDEVKVARETVLTAFSIQPTRYRLNRIIELAKRSGYEVLDTGQEEWKCRLHPPVSPSDDLAWICPECGEWMCKPVLTAPPQVNMPLEDALQECLLDIPLAMRDDLVVCLSNPRYQILSWVLAWNDLHRLCIFYLNDPEKTKNFVTELKFIHPDYSKFNHIKREPVDEYAGIEKGYEQYLDLNFNPGEEKSTVRDDDSISREGSDENGDSSSLSQTTSNPNTLKSLRMYRPNLKRKKVDDKISIQEKKATQATQSPSESKVARISPTGSDMTTVGNFSGYKSDSLLASSISETLPSCTQSRDSVVSAINSSEAITYNAGQANTPIKLKKGNSTQSSASTSHTVLDTLFNDSINEINLETQPNINNSKNVIAATLPQLGGQVAQNQPSQVHYQQESHKVNQTKLQLASLQGGTIAGCKMKPKNCSMSKSLNRNAKFSDQVKKRNPARRGLNLRAPSFVESKLDNQLPAQMKELTVRIIPLEHSQLPTPKTLTVKQNLTQLPTPSVMKQGFPQTVLESPVPAPITLNLIPDFQQTPYATKTLRTKPKKLSTKMNILASMKPIKKLVILLRKVPELEALVVAIPTAKSIKIFQPQPSIPTPRSMTISNKELDSLLPTPKSPIYSTELNPLLPTPKSMTASKTEVDFLTTTNTKLATATKLDPTSAPELDILTSSLIEAKTIASPTLKSRIQELDLLSKTITELEAKTAPTTEFNVLNMSTTKLNNLATSCTEVELLTTPTAELDVLTKFELTTSKTDLNFPTTSKTELEILTSLKTELGVPTTSVTEAHLNSLKTCASKLSVSFQSSLASYQCSEMSHGDNNIIAAAPWTPGTPSKVEVPVQITSQHNNFLISSTFSSKNHSTMSSTCKIVGFPQLTAQETTTSTEIIHTGVTKPVTLAKCTTLETLAVCRTPETLATCTTPEATFSTEVTYPPKAPVQVQLETLPKFTTQESPTAVARQANSLLPTCATLEAKFLTEATHPPKPPVQVQLETLPKFMTQESPRAVVRPANSLLATCATKKATFLTEATHPPKPPAQVQLETLPKVTTQESPTAVVRPANSLLATCATKEATFLTEATHPPKPPVQVQLETLPKFTTQESPRAVVRRVNSLLAPCTTPEATFSTEASYPPQAPVQVQLEALPKVTTQESPTAVVRPANSLLATCTTPEATFSTEATYPPQAPVKVQLETLTNFTTQESPTAVVRPANSLLATCTTPVATFSTEATYPPQAPVQVETLTKFTTQESPTAVVRPVNSLLATCTIPEATFSTAETYPPQAPVQVQLETLSKFTTQESPTAVVCPGNSLQLNKIRIISDEMMKILLPCASINQGVCRASVKLEQLQEAPIVPQKIYGMCKGPCQVYTIPASKVRFDKDKVLDCHKKTDIQSTKNGRDMASDKIETYNKTVKVAYVTVINGADNCSTISNVNKNLSCDNDMNVESDLHINIFCEVPLDCDTDFFMSDCTDFPNDLDKGNLKNDDAEIMTIVAEETDNYLSDSAVPSKNVAADIITENITNIDFTSTYVTAAMLKSIPNSLEIVHENILEDSLPLNDYSGTRDTASTTSEMKVNNLQLLPKYSQSEDGKCLNQYKSHKKFQKTDVLVQRLESSFGLWNSCNFPKKPKIENLASAIEDNYFKTNNDSQSNISVFSKAKNYRDVKLQISWDDAFESWAPWKWHKSNLKMYSNNRKRKHDSVPCFKLDIEKKDCKPFSVDLQRLPNQISSYKANLISKPTILLNKYVKKTPFNDFTNLNEIGLKKNGYGTLKRMSHQNNKPIPKTRKFIQQFQRISNTKSPNFISIPGLHDYSEISPRNITHVVNVVQHGNPRSSTVTNTDTQTSTQVTPHIQRIGQAKLDRKPDHYDVDPEPSSSTVMSAPSTSQSTLINILSSPKTSQKSTQPRQTPIVNILSQQIYMPSLDQQTATVIKVEPEDHADVQATKTVNTNVRIVTTTTQAGATPTTSAPAQGGAILQFICKSSSLPKFQQAFGKAVYQTGTTAEVGTSETPTTSNEVTNQTQTATSVETKKIAAKAVPVNVQPITGNVIFRGQVPIGQTVSLIPPGSNTRQLFRITGSTHEQISLVKETVIQNKMSALLAAALQGKPKITEQNGELVEEYSATRITLCRPGSVPPNATRIVKPVQLQIPANVIRAPQPNVSSTTLEQLREFDMVYKQVKERSSNPAQPEATPQTTAESPQQQRISFTYVNQVQKYTQLSPVVVVSSYSPIQQTVSPAVSVTSQSGSGSGVTQVSTVAVPKVAVKSSKGKSIKSSVLKTSPTTVVPAIPKPQQKPQEDEHTTQRIFDILAEYAEQLRNSPDLNNKPAPRRRSNPPTNPSSNTSSSPSKKKKKKSTSSSTSNLVETDNEDLTMGSEDSSGGNAVQLSMTDEEQSQSASITPPESNLEPATSNASTTRPLIVTDTSSQPRNVIIADSSVGETLKIPNTALLMPGNYIMPVSVVKGGQQIAVVSGGSKILTTVPARSGQNMLLLQSFVNQNKKGGISTVKYSTLQPFSTISQNVTTVTAQTSVVLPSNSVSTVSLGQPITLKKIDDNERGNSTELLLTISQPRESVKVDNTEVPQPDSSTNLLPCEAIEVKIEEASSSHLSNNEVFNNIQETNSVATSVIASVIKKDDDETQTGDSSMKGAGAPRAASVLVNTSTSNGPMLSHTNTRYRKATEGIESTSASTKQFNHNLTKVPQAAARILKNNTVYYTIRTKKAVSKKIDSEMQKQAAIERELRLQKTLSEECEDLGVDEPSTSDLFPEADLLFDSNHSPSYDQSGQRIQGTDSKTKGSLHLFSDDENSEPLRNDLFDYVEYHPPETGIDQVNGNSISNESASSCDDSTLLPNCGSMSEVTLNSPISLDYPDNSHKYKYKYTNRKKGEKFNRPPENWQEVTEVTSSEDAMEIVKEDDTPIAIQEETVIDESLTEVEADEMKNPKNSEADAAALCPIHNSMDNKSPRKALKKICLCFNGTSNSPNTTSTKRRFSSQGSTSCKKVLINKKR